MNKQFATFEPRSWHEQLYHNSSTLFLISHLCGIKCYSFNTRASACVGSSRTNEFGCTLNQDAFSVLHILCFGPFFPSILETFIPYPASTIHPYTWIPPVPYPPDAMSLVSENFVHFLTSS